MRDLGTPGWQNEQGRRRKILELSVTPLQVRALTSHMAPRVPRARVGKWGWGQLGVCQISYDEGDRERGRHLLCSQCSPISETRKAGRPRGRRALTAMPESAGLAFPRTVPSCLAAFLLTGSRVWAAAAHMELLA